MGKKRIFLFVALLLPALVFVFLKMFGKNEFDVAVMFQKERPVAEAGCPEVALPYTVDKDILKEVLSTRNNLVLVWFMKDSVSSAKGATELGQLRTELAKDPVSIIALGSGDEHFHDWYACRFLLRAPQDAVLVDKNGGIRGQYELADRDEADRLRTEITILLKKY